MLLLQRTQNPQTKEVSRELYTRVSKFLKTPKIGRFKATDADKDLELSICKELFELSNHVLPPKDLSEEFAEIDAYINGEGVQIKCRNGSNFLTLEDYKTRSTGERTSWVDRNMSQYTVFVFTTYEPCLTYCIYETSDLKRLLNLLRKAKSGEQITKLDEHWLDIYFKNWKYYEYSVLDKNKSTECALYKVLI